MTNICGINVAESNRTILRTIEEDPNCWAVTPTTGIVREMRYTSSSLAASKQTKMSTEIRADRMVPSIIEVSASSGGDINGEFSAGTHDQFFQNFVLGTWTRPMTYDRFSGATVSIASTSTVDIAGGDYTAYFIVGRAVKLEGFKTPGNNDYFVISARSFASGKTTITFTTSTLTIEGGSAYTAICDANDVVIMKSTVMRFGTTGNTFDTNGGNGFTTAIAAKQLVVGQKIYVETALARSTSVLTLTGVPTDADTVTLGDGEKTVVFEFDSNGGYVRGRVPVVIGVDEDATAANFQAAVMDQLNRGKIKMSASVALGVVTLRCLSAFTGTVTESAANLVVTSAFTAYAPGYSGFYTLTSVSNDVLTVAETVAVNTNAGAVAVTIKGSHLRNPGVLSEIIKQSRTIETGFTDVAQYFLQKGLRVGKFKLQAQEGDIVSVMFGLEGKNTISSPVSILGNAPYTVLASTSTEAMNATINVGSITKNGVALSTALQSIEINGDAKTRRQGAISNKFAAGIGYGQMSVTGKISAYFETLEMYDHFLEHDTISLSFDFADSAGNSYTFTMPAVKILSDPIAPGGLDQDIMESLDFATQRDPNLNTQFMIDRFSSTQAITA